MTDIVIQTPTGQFPFFTDVNSEQRDFKRIRQGIKDAYDGVDEFWQGDQLVMCIDAVVTGEMIDEALGINRSSSTSVKAKKCRTTACEEPAEYQATWTDGKEMSPRLFCYGCAKKIDAIVLDGSVWWTRPHNVKTGMLI